MTNRKESDEERQKLFRKMEWVFVYAPPLIALFIGVFGGFFIATIVPVSGTTFLGRWVLAVLIILVLPAIIYAVRFFLNK
ncbi:MAG: hypothetical protein GEU90_01795 [Gemmatimonas sp.]|nr:hypothetical protein [Gemmatimonas sp.]